MSTRAFTDAGQLALDYAAVDWPNTPVGTPETWPQSLRTAMSICLASRFPILLWWGPELTMLYNEAYLPIVKDKHPGSLAAPGRHVWPEIWSIIGPMLSGVLSGRGATYSEDQLLLLNRRGFVEECYFTFSYSPILDESHEVGGVFTAVTETTDRVLSERRLQVLSRLGEVMPAARTETEVLQVVAEHLAATPDTPGIAVLRRADDGWRKVAEAGRPVAERSSAGRVISVPLLDGGRSDDLALRCLVSEHLEPDTALVDFLSVAARQAASGLSAVAELEAERRRAAALAELDAAKTAFFGNISHELRTPLTLLAGPLDDLLKPPRPLTAEAQRTRLELADRNARRLRTLVDSLLDFTRLEARRMVPRLTSTDLGALTVQLTEVFRPAIEDAGLELRVETPPAEVRTMVDPQLWEPILYNLLSNALKHTFSGTVTVRLGTDAPHPGGDVVRLEVEDTGVGIPAAQLDKVFDRFHRVEGTAARSREGSGIGLALVRELVHLHGGQIQVTSELGVGSRFSVTLPRGPLANHPAQDVEQPGAAPGPSPDPARARAASEEATRWVLASRIEAPATAPAQTALEPTALVLTEQRMSPAAPARVGQRPAVRRHHVLIADDSDDMRRYVADVIRDLADVTVAVDGEDALQSLHAARRHGRPVDLVIADIMMPVRDGLSLLHELKSDPRTAHLPVLLLSARAGEEAALGGLEAGADDYIAKPFTARELLARVRSQLRLAKARDLQLAAERSIAVDLQQALLPNVPRSAPGLAFAARYVSGTDNTSVGGDFYDAVTLPDGRTAVVVGDVVGRGPAAAALMGQLRAAWRTETLREQSPADVLEALSVTLASLDVPLATCLHGLYDPAAGRLQLISAGHPPPLLCTPSATGFVELEPGPPLGVPGPAYRETTIAFNVNDCVLLYTDGLIESRDSDLDLGMKALLDLADTPAPSIEARCDQLLTTLRPGSDHPDDIALLAVQAVSRHSPGVHEALLEFDASITTPQIMRSHVRELLDLWGMSALTDTALLLATELVTNAVVHAGGHIDVLLSTRPNLLHIAVTDQDRALPVLEGTDVGSEHGRGLLIVDRVASRWGSDRLPDGKRVWFELDH